MHCQVFEKITSVSPWGIILPTNVLGYKEMWKIALNFYFSSESFCLPYFPILLCALLPLPNLSTLPRSFFLWLDSPTHYQIYLLHVCHNIWQLERALEACQANTLILNLLSWARGREPMTCRRLVCNLRQESRAVFSKPLSCKRYLISFSSSDPQPTYMYMLWKSPLHAFHNF